MKHLNFLYVLARFGFLVLFIGKVAFILVPANIAVYDGHLGTLRSFKHTYLEWWFSFEVQTCINETVILPAPGECGDRGRKSTRPQHPRRSRVWTGHLYHWYRHRICGGGVGIEGKLLKDVHLFSRMSTCSKANSTYVAWRTCNLKPNRTAGMHS